MSTKIHHIFKRAKGLARTYGLFFLKCKGNLSCEAGVQGASFLSESREGKCRCHSWEGRFILANREEKYFQKEKRKLTRIPSPFVQPANMSRTCKGLNLRELSWSPAGLDLCWFLFGEKPGVSLQEWQDCEN